MAAITSAAMDYLLQAVYFYDILWLFEGLNT